MDEFPKPRRLPAALPFGLIGATAVYVLYRRSVDSDAAVSGALVMTGSAFFTALLIEAVSRFAPANLHGLDGEAARRIAAATRGLVRLTELALAVSMSAAALILVRTHRLDAGPFAAIVLGTLAMAIVLGTRHLSRTVSALRRENRVPTLRGWHGVFYRNPDDRRLWVPKITGLGWTLNFAHPAAWPILIALLLPPLLALFFTGFDGG